MSAKQPVPVPANAIKPPPPPAPPARRDPVVLVTVYAAPKPEPRVKQPKPAKPRSPIAKSNPERRERLFEDAFGSVERVEWINAMPCAICDVTGWTENAHVRSRGAGGKACDVVPLCGSRTERGIGIEGCHQVFDCHPWDLPEGTVTQLRALAKQLDTQWNERGAA